MTRCWDVAARVALALLLPSAHSAAQTAFPWEQAPVPRMAAEPVGGQLVAHVPLKFWAAVPSASDEAARVTGTLQSAQRCLDGATLAHGLRLILEPAGHIYVSQGDLHRYASTRSHLVASGLERSAFRSVEAPFLNIFVVDDVGFASHRYLGATAAIDADRDDSGKVLAFRGARDIQLAADARGDVLAHEILHAWGGLVDRRGDESNLMNDRMMTCSLTPEQVRVAIRHSRGGPSEVAK